MYNNNFLKCQIDYYCYVNKFDNFYIILLLYIDDMLIVGASMKKLNKLKRELSKKFAMKDSRGEKQILAMRMARDT